MSTPDIEPGECSGELQCLYLGRLVHRFEICSRQFGKEVPKHTYHYPGKNNTASTSAYVQTHLLASIHSEKKLSRLDSSPMFPIHATCWSGRHKIIHPVFPSIP